jgi:hypothetical protein
VATQFALAFQHVVFVGQRSTSAKLQRHVLGVGKHAAKRLAQRKQQAAVLDLFSNARVQIQYQLAQGLHHRETDFTESANVFKQIGNAGSGHGAS